jgi:hypothetical protein
MDTGIALRTLMSGVKASEPSELHATLTPMKPDLERHAMKSFDQHVSRFEFLLPHRQPVPHLW